ncbi:tetratricopeptide repeat protein [Caenispirillum bisanense]|uniref:Predicted O-linked N-acetylglucosamine transferase, SPINDLY family n=1 Tax=Caenispirillum bisanense TaxID=414052 RepID=A0A286GYQ0_9PROT|nr:tetratricopeptide repeat protein [Caenispirillum bisanense]SOE00194.1 Predicted O-linked N-acetylglucosamine transferase, SPINDLY family [Caenispirillum bisanense]
MSRTQTTAAAVAPDAAATAALRQSAALLAAGRAEDAASVAVGVLQRDNRIVDAWRALVAPLRQLGRGQDLVTALENVCALAPTDGDAWAALAGEWRQRGLAEKAEAAAQRAIAAGAAAEGWRQTGLLAIGSGRITDAAAAFERAWQAAPGDAGMVVNLLNSLVELRGFGRALEILDALPPAVLEDADVAYVAGVVYRHRGRLEESVRCYLRAMASRVEAADAAAAVRDGLGADGRLTPACRAAVAGLPDAQVHAPAFGELGSVLAVFRAFDDAMTLMERAAALPATRQERRSDSLLFCANYHPDLTADEIREIYRRYEDRTRVPALPAIDPADRRRADGRPLRVGYVSPDFRGHSCAQFIEPVVAAHDPAAVEVVAYAELSQPDEVTERIRPHFAAWRPTVGVSDEAFCRQVRDDGIDILVDLAGHTTRNRLQAMRRRPAPVQATWIGYCFTTGLEAIDYYIGDAVSAPAGSDHLFAEKVVRLPFVLGCYTPPPGTPEPVPTPALAAGHVTFGCLSRAIRVNDRVLGAWAQILHRVPDSRLVLNSRHFGDPFLARLTVAKFGSLGIAPERLDIGFTRGAWDLYNRIDILLDCFPHNSGTTTFEAFWMGVPVVTVTDRPPAGRLGAAVANTVGHPELIAYSEREYVEVAARLAGDVAALDALRQSLRPAIAASPIMDARRFVRTLEAAYGTMFDRWQNGLPPASFSVAEPR